MEQSFESSITMPVIIAGFAVLFVLQIILSRHFRKRRLINQGQITTEGGKVPSIEERLAGNKSWASGQILSRGRIPLFFALSGALTWNLLLGIGFIKYLSKPDMKIAPLIVLGVFNLFGIVFAVFAVRAAIKYLRYGQSSCHIQNKAGVLGQTLTGVIRTKNAIEASGPYSINIECNETYSTGSGKNRNTKTRIHWQARQEVSHEGKNSKAGIPFSFELPKFPPETGERIMGNVHWLLRIHAPVKGVDYAADFTIPIFRMDYTN